MRFLNVNIKGLNGLVHPALYNVKTTSSVRKMRPHIKMLCGDYYTYQLKAKYQGGSPNCKLCKISPEQNDNIENIEHILTQCSAYSDIRQRIFLKMKHLCDQIPTVDFEELLSNPRNLTQFLLDCTSLNLSNRINCLDENCSKMFDLSRDLCFSINKLRLKKLKDLQP